MPKSLTSLKKERDRLIKQRATVEEKRSLRVSNERERRLLESEIKALKKPAATEAKRRFKAFTKSASKAILKRASIVRDNIVRQAAEEERREKRQVMRQRSRKKVVRRRNPVKKKKVSRSTRIR